MQGRPENEWAVWAYGLMPAPFPVSAYGPVSSVCLCLAFCLLISPCRNLCTYNCPAFGHCSAHGLGVTVHPPAVEWHQTFLCACPPTPPPSHICFAAFVDKEKEAVELQNELFQMEAEIDRLRQDNTKKSQEINKLQQADDRKRLLQQVKVAPPLYLVLHMQPMRPPLPLSKPLSLCTSLCVLVQFQAFMQGWTVLWKSPTWDQ